MKNRKLPFGYELRMGKVCIKESEAEVVRLIFHSYREGASYNRIAGFLGSQPVPYREGGQPWNKNMVARILQDERYTGMDDFPRVIEPEIFQTTQQKRPKTGGSPENAKELRLLRDMVVCAHCGTPMARNQRDNWTCPQCGGPPVRKTGPELLADLQLLLTPYTRHPEKIQAPPYRTQEHRDLELRLEQAMTSVNEPEQPVYQEEFMAINEQMTTLQTRRVQLLEAQQADLAITGRLQEAESLLAGTPAEITEWDEALVRQTVETVKVLSAHEILVCLKDGTEIRETVL